MRRIQPSTRHLNSLPGQGISEKAGTDYVQLERGQLAAQGALSSISLSTVSVTGRQLQSKKCYMENSGNELPISYKKLLLQVTAIILFSH